MSAFSHSGSVYFARCGQYVKIGYCSGDLSARLRHLPRGVICPDDLDRSRPVELIHEIPGCVIRDERRIHGLFAAYREAGEWFRYDARFIWHLSRLRYVTYAETLLNARRYRAALKAARARQAAA